MKDPILCECEECGDIALEAAYGGMKCSGCMLDAIDDTVVIDSVGRAIAMLLQDVVREHGPKQSAEVRYVEKLRAALDQGCAPGCNCFQCEPSRHRPKSPFVPSMTSDQARAVFQQRHGRSADTAQNIAHQSEPSADEMKELTRFEQNVIDRAVHSVAARAEQVASPTCSKCMAETTHAASCGCGKCYGCCAT